MIIEKEKYKKTISNNNSALEDFIVDSEADIYDIKFINYYLKKFTSRLNVHTAQENFLDGKNTVRNLQTEIVDAQSYFLASKEIQYSYIDSANNKDFIEFLESTLVKNDSLSKNLELLKESLKFGQAYELVYFEKDSNNDIQVKFTTIHSKNCFLVYSNTSNQKILSAFIVSEFENYKTAKIEYTLKQITSDKIIDYKMSKDYKIKTDSILNETANIANKVLVSVSKCSKDNKPTFYPSLASILRLEYFDSILDGVAQQTVKPIIIFKNLGINLTQEMIEKGITEQNIIDVARETGNMSVMSENFGENADLTILESKTSILEIKQLADDVLLEIKSQNGLIDMSKNLKSNSSADSMKFQFVDLDRKVSNILPFFKMALYNRLQLIVNIYNYFNLTNINASDISFEFVKNTTLLKETDSEDVKDEFISEEML